mgnify:CR=1 FL=1
MLLDWAAFAGVSRPIRPVILVRWIRSRRVQVADVEGAGERLVEHVEGELPVPVRDAAVLPARSLDLERQSPCAVGLTVPVEALVDRDAPEQELLCHDEESLRRSSASYSGRATRSSIGASAVMLPLDQGMLPAVTGAEARDDGGRWEADTFVDDVG